jgi:hypothetical protein
LNIKLTIPFILHTHTITKGGNPGFIEIIGVVESADGGKKEIIVVGLEAWIDCI